MSMTVDTIRKFVEEDYKDYAIMITCDNEHKYYYNTKGNPSVIWNWDDGTFTALETREEVNDQNGHPFEITKVAIEEIQFITAYVDMATAIDFINKNYTDEKQKEVAKKVLKRMKPCLMAPNTLKELGRESRTPYPNK